MNIASQNASANLTDCCLQIFQYMDATWSETVFTFFGIRVLTSEDNIKYVFENHTSSQQSEVQL